MARLAAPSSGTRGTEAKGATADSRQQEPLTDPRCRVTGEMLAVISASPIVISCIVGIGIQQAERAATSDANSVIISATDTNLNRPAITACILLNTEEVFCD